MEASPAAYLRRYCDLLIDFLNLVRREASWSVIDSKRDEIDHLVHDFQQHPDFAGIEEMDPLIPEVGPKVICHVAFTSHWSWMKQNQANLKALLNLKSRYGFMHLTLRKIKRNSFWDGAFDSQLNEKARAVILTAFFVYFKRASQSMTRLDPGICQDLIICHSQRLDAFPSVSDEFKEFVTAICSTQPVQEAASHLQLSFGSQVQRILGRTFYAPFDAFHGLTCLGDFVAIRELYQEDYGASLVVFLHEFAHMAKRFGDRAKYFQELSPESEIMMKGTIVRKQEAGFRFETVLFGSKVTQLYIEASNFLLELNNWICNRETFVTAFQTAQQTGKNNNSAFVDLTRFGGDGGIGSCAFGLRD